MADRIDQAANRSGSPRAASERLDGLGLAGPPQRDGRLAPDGRVGVGQQGRQPADRLAVAAEPAAPGRLEADPRGAIVDRVADGLPRPVVIDGVECPERMQAAGLGLLGLQSADEEGDRGDSLRARPRWDASRTDTAG